MNETFLGFIFLNPGFFLTAFVVHGFAGALISYGVAYLFMRPKAGAKIANAFMHHTIGIVAVTFGAAIFRVFASATFAGRDAYVFPKETLDSSIYLLVVPFIMSLLYLFWLKNNKISNTVDKESTQTVLSNNSPAGSGDKNRNFVFTAPGRLNPTTSSKKYERALAAYNYRNEIKNAYQEIASMPIRSKIEFLNCLEENPKIDASQLIKAVNEKYNEWLRRH